MTRAIYEAIGRLVVRYVRTRYRRQIRIAVGLCIGAVVAGGYLAATREPPEA
jgi:hypothetical protein